LLAQRAPQKDERERPGALLARRTRTVSGARSMRAVKGNLALPSREA